MARTTQASKQPVEGDGRVEQHMKRKTNAPVSLNDLKARLALLKAHGVRSYNDGLLEIHLDTTKVPVKRPELLDPQVDLGKV